MLLQEMNGNSYISDPDQSEYKKCKENVNGEVMNGTRHNEEFIKRASDRLEEQYGHSFLFREFAGENGL